MIFVGFFELQNFTDVSWLKNHESDLGKFMLLLDPGVADMFGIKMLATCLVYYAFMQKLIASGYLRTQIMT